MRRNRGIRSLRGQGIPRYAIGGDIPDPDDPSMTITAEGVPITLDAPQRGWRSQLPINRLREKMGGLLGLSAWEMVRDRTARGIENADVGLWNALRVLPRGMRESMANVLDESKLTADDLPENVHDFARMIAAQAIAEAGPNADVQGLHIPYPTQEFAAEHFDPSLMDRLAGKAIGTDVDPESAEAIGFRDPSGWGATFGQGTMYEDPEGNIHLIDRYNFPNMTAGQVPGREEDTSTQFSDYARGLGPHEGKQFREDMLAFWGQKNKSKGRRALNMARHYMSEFGSTEDDPTEGRSWDINLGPREELLAAYAAANDPQPSRMARGLGWLRGLVGRDDRDDDVRLAERRIPPIDESAMLRERLESLDLGTPPSLSIPDLDFDVQ